MASRYAWQWESRYARGAGSSIGGAVSVCRDRRLTGISIRAPRALLDRRGYVGSEAHRRYPRSSVRCFTWNGGISIRPRRGPLDRQDGAGVSRPAGVGISIRARSSSADTASVREEAA